MAFRPEAALDLLRRSRADGRLAHAYLVTGPRGSGKEALVLALLELVGHPRAGRLEECRSDHVQIVRPESKSRRIRVDEMRDMEKRLYLAVPGSVTKVAIILDADRMMVEAANAFLKTLEEPPERSLIILISAQPELLLETILSRCLRIPLVAGASPELSEREVRLLSDLQGHFTAGGSAGTGGVWVLLQRFTECLREEKAALKKGGDEDYKREQDLYKQTTDGDWLKRREDYHGTLAHAGYLRRRGELIELLVAWFGDALRARNGVDRVELEAFRAGTAATARKHGTGELLRRVEALEQLRLNLGTNVSENLALEVAFLEAFG